MPKIGCNIVSQKSEFWHRFGNVLEVDFGQKSVNFQDVSQASISNIIFMRCCCCFLDTPQPKKKLFSCRKHVFLQKQPFTHHIEKTSILRAFWHHFSIRGGGRWALGGEGEGRNGDLWGPRGDPRAFLDIFV